MASESLSEYISRRRSEKNYSRDEVADRARRAGFKLSGSYIAKIERGTDPTTGKPVRPTLETIRALAKGLGEDEDTLIRIARGEEPKTGTLITSEPGPMLEVIEGFQKRYEPTDDELATIRELDRIGVWHSEFTQPSFWMHPPEEREGSFFYLKGLIREFKRRNPTAN